MNFLWKILAPTNSFAQNIYVVFFIFIGMIFIMPTCYRLLMEIEAVKAIGRFAVPFFFIACHHRYFCIIYPICNETSWKKWTFSSIVIETVITIFKFFSNTWVTCLMIGFLSKMPEIYSIIIWFHFIELLFTMSAQKTMSVRRFLLLSGSIFFAVILFLQYLFISPDLKEALKVSLLQTLFRAG